MMNDPALGAAGKNKRARIKAVLFLVFIVAAVTLVRFTPVKDFVTEESLSSFLETAGFWAPLVFMLVYAAGVCLFLPGTLLTAIGAAIFGPYWGFVYVWIGAMFGAGEWPECRFGYMCSTARLCLGLLCRRSLLDRTNTGKGIYRIPDRGPAQKIR